MDISSLDSKIAGAPTAGSRRRDGAEEGFRGVMELMAHLSAQTSSKTDEAPRQRASEPRPAERAADPVKDEAREPVEKDTATDDTRDSEAREDRPEARAAAPAAPADPTTAGQATDNASTRLAGGTGDGPAVPPSTRSPTQLGVPADGVPGNAAPQGAAETPTTNPANVAPAPNGTVAQAAASPTPTTDAAQAQVAAPQVAEAQAGQAQVAQASPNRTPAGQPSAAQAATVSPAANQASSAAPQTAQSQTAQSQTAQVPQAQAAQDAAARSTATPQPPAGTDPTVTSGQAVAEARSADGRNKTLPRDVKVTVDQAPVIARAQGVSSAVLVQAHMAAADGTGKNGASQAAPLQQGTTLHVGGGQALFVGADAGNAHPGGAQGADGGQSGGQNSGGQNAGGQNAGGQAQAGNTFPFGAATIGQRGFGGDAARAQFQEILSTRTARAPLQGAGTTSSGSPSSLPFTAGPGGPQSTLTTAMASRAEATAQGRPGALPSTAVGQVAVKLANSAADGGGKVTIRLNPEELGKVDVKLELGKDGTVHAKISAEKPETLDMLQRDARLLDKALQDAGLKTDQNSLEFDLRGGNGQPTDRQEQQLASAGASPPGGGETGEQTASDTSTPAGSGGVRADGSYDLVA